MNDDIRKKVSEAKELYEIAKAKGDSGNFAYKLAARSLESHLDELTKIELTSQISSVREMLDLRIIAPNLKTGSAPLYLVSKLLEEIQKILGYAALRLEQNDTEKKIVLKDLYEKLDIRFQGLLPGSSRFIISVASNRDLFNYSLSKSAIERMFAVLSSMGKDENFITSVNTLGPSGAKSLRELLKVIKSYSATTEFTWKYLGNDVLKWNGTEDAINSVTSALEVTEISEQRKVKLHGKVELLSKREKIELRTDEGELIKIFYPESKLPQISKLHLEQKITLHCEVTETESPLTGESSIHYDLLEIGN